MSGPLTIVSPVFAKRTASLAGPQADAFAWADARAGGGAAYMLLALERYNARSQRSWREYRACEMAEFVRAQCAGGGDSHLCVSEIVLADAPCLTYLDLELKFTDADARAKAEAAGYADAWPPPVASLAAARDALLDALAADLRARASLPADAEFDYALSSAHKESKWSCHATLDARVGASVLWRSNIDCRVCVLAARDRVARTHPLVAAIVDDGVYSRNRIMRCVGSSKAAEPCRMLRPLANEAVGGAQYACCGAPKTIEPAVFAQSLITLVRVPRTALGGTVPRTSRALPAAAGDDCVWTTTHFLAHRDHSVPLLVAARAAAALVPSAAARQRPASRRAAPLAQGGGLVGRICAHRTFAAYSPAPRFKESVDPRRFVLPCYGSHCDFAGTHGPGKAPTYLLLDMARGRWTQRCHNSRCVSAQERAAPERSMAPDLAHLCAAYMRDVWPGGTLVGGLAHRLGIA